MSANSASIYDRYPHGATLRDLYEKDLLESFFYEIDLGDEVYDDSMFNWDHDIGFLVRAPFCANTITFSHIPWDMTCEQFLTTLEQAFRKFSAENACHPDNDEYEDTVRDEAWFHTRAYDIASNRLSLIDQSAFLMDDPKADEHGVRRLEQAVESGSRYSLIDCMLERMLDNTFTAQEDHLTNNPSYVTPIGSMIDSHMLTGELAKLGLAANNSANDTCGAYQRDPAITTRNGKYDIEINGPMASIPVELMGLDPTMPYGQFLEQLAGQLDSVKADYWLEPTTYEADRVESVRECYADQGYLHACAIAVRQEADRLDREMSHDDKGEQDE